MNEKPELQLEPVEGELQPVGKMPMYTAEQMNALAVIASVSKVEVLANTEETAQGIERMKASYLPIIEAAKADLANAKIKADFERAKEYRLAIRSERLGFTDVIDSELSARKLIIDSAKKGKEKVEDAFKSLEDELLAAEKPVDERFKAAAAAKKALADAIAKLKAHTINPLLSAAKIETAIDDFTLAFGDTDYTDSQDTAEEIFESKVTEFEVILSAAVVREENERKIKEQQAQQEQRANIAVMFPIAEISGYANGYALDIKNRIDWISFVSMDSFDLVLSEAEAAKKSCLSVLNVFLDQAVAREQEAADKADSERLQREKQYQDDWDLAVVDDIEWCKIKSSEPIEIRGCECCPHLVGDIFERDCDYPNCSPDLKEETAVITIINDDTAFIEDVAKIIGEPVNECVEVASEPIADDCVLIPVKYLKALVDAVRQAYDYEGVNEEVLNALMFAKSLI